MSRKIIGEFEVRREAELAVERIVQEYGIDRSAIEVTAAGDENTAGVVPSGADRASATGEPASSPVRGRIRVSVTADDAVAGRVEEGLRQARGV